MRHFNFVGLKSFNFAVHPKYYISRDFNFVICPKYYNLRHFTAMVVLEIELFMGVRFQLFSNFGKSMEPKSELKYISIFFTHHRFTKLLTPRKLHSASKILSSSSSESPTGFINPKNWRSSSNLSRSFA